MNEDREYSQLEPQGRSRLGLSVAVGIMVGAIAGVLLQDMLLGLIVAVAVAAVSAYGTARLV